MASQASAEPKESGAPMRSEPKEAIAAAARETSAGPPDEDSSLDPVPAVPVAPQGGTRQPASQPTPDDDPDDEAFEEALEGGEDGEDGFSDAAKAAALVDNGDAKDGEPPSKTVVLTTVGANYQPESSRKVYGENPKTEARSQDEILAAEEKESAENPTLQSTEENPIEGETAVAGDVSGNEEHAKEEEYGGLAEESGESASPATEGMMKSKTDAAEEEGDGARADAVDEVKFGIAGSADSDQNVYPVNIPAAHSVTNGVNEKDKDKNVAQSYSNVNTETVEVSSNGSEGIADVGVTKKGDNSSASSKIGDIKSTEDSADKVDTLNEGENICSMPSIHETGNEKLAIEQDQTANESEAKTDEPVPELVPDGDGSISVQGRQSPFVTAEESNSRETEGDKFGASDVATEDGNTQLPNSVPEPEPKLTSVENLAVHVQNLNHQNVEEEDKSLDSDGPARVVTYSEILEKMYKAWDKSSASNIPHSALDRSKDGDGMITLDSDGEWASMVTDEEDEGKEMIDSVGGKFGTSGVTKDGNAQLPNSVPEPELKPTPVENLPDHVQNLDHKNVVEEDKNLDSDGPPRVAILASSETAKQMIKELDEGSSSTILHSALDRAKDVDGQIILDSDEEVVTDEEDEGKEMIDSDALLALLRAASSSSADGDTSVTSQGGTRIFSVDRPAGLGSSIPALKPAPTRPTRPNLLSHSELPVVAEPDNNMTEEQKKLQEKVELIRVKFLRLVHRLGHSPEDTVAAQVLYRLSLAEGIRSGRQTSRAFSLDSAKKKALQLEQDGTEDLDFSCNILVLGKSGVGKSATINSIFGEEKSQTSAFKPATSSVKEIVGTVDGVKVRVIDTPGLRPSGKDQASSRRILTSIKKYTKRCPPDIVLYVDRMDTLTRDQNDLPLLRTITSTLGSSIWFNAIVALTHAASAPPDGPGGSPLSYEVFVAQRSHAVQQSIRLAAGDMRLMNPVALVENHPSCRRNREGQRVLPNGLTWRPQMLLLCYSSKILSEANSLLKLQDPSAGKLFGFRLRSPPLPFLLSSQLQSRAHPKLATDQGGENEDSDIELDDLSDTDQEEEDEYDQLPPFKPLKKSQIAKLTKVQRKAYFDEYDYRVKLLQKKQWKEELRRMKEMKNRQKVPQDGFEHADMVEDWDQDNGPATVPVPLPDMVLPPSFDCDAPTYRYRFLEPTSQLLARPVLDTHGWDHDCGYDGVSLEESLAVGGWFPAVISAQVTKDKKEFSIHLDSSIAAKHGENGSTLVGFDIQAVGKQLAYILRGETKFKTLKKNRTTGGISVTFLGETVATGLKLEDQFYIGKRVKLVASTGAVRAQGDTAYGANLEARLHDKDYPIGQALSTLGLSLMRWHGDLALGANLQSQFSVGRNSKMAVRVGLNNKMTGQITVRTSASEQLQLALVGIIPIAMSIFRSIKPDSSLG